MKTIRKKTRLSTDSLRVDSFTPLETLDLDLLAADFISNNDSRCPSRPDSLCPCCTGPYLCPTG